MKMLWKLEKNFEKIKINFIFIEFFNKTVNFLIKALLIFILKANWALNYI